jgi:asparagine synthetase B (glutamine-hydrolysing)
VTPARWAMTPMEVLWTVPYGPADGVAPLPDVRVPLRAALEQVVLQALLRPPCVVSFSGGRDSSTVLAVATSVARREGLELPVPVTNRFPAVASADESDWQEQVVRTLALPEWTRATYTDELDVGGEIARDVLHRLGVCAPFNLHFHAPLVRLAGGGSVLTGVGGDELFSPVSRRVTYRLLSRRWPVRPRSVVAAAGELAPRVVRTRRAARRARMPYAWVRPDVLARLRHEVCGWGEREPLSWSNAVRRTVWPGRRLQAHREGLERLGALHDVRVLSPFAEARVLSAAAHAWGPAGPRGRALELEATVGDLLPLPVLRRRTKSSFNGAFWSGPGREWARNWTGSGVDDRLVEPAALQAEWASDDPDPHSFSLLHQALLAERSG